MKDKKTVNLKKLCYELKISCNEDIEISSLNTLNDASQNEITFLENKKYLKDLKNTKAAAIFINKEFAPLVPKTSIALICDEPYVALAYASKFFSSSIVQRKGESAVIHESSILVPSVNIGFGVNIAKNCTILSGAYIGDNVSIGENTIIHANVTIYKECIIGANCIIHSGTVIGSDGFGFAQKDGKYIKIYQNGNVIIEDDVEIGANCAIDRAAFKSTLICTGVRIDNLVHIAHNCILEKGCILTGQVGLAGSSVLKQYVIMGAQSGVAGHLEIAPFTTVSARGGVTKSIKEPKKQWAGFPLMEHRTWLRLQAKISKLLK